MAKRSTKQAFVVGWPISHTRSPLIHSYWLKKYDIDGSYDKHACDPEDFSGFLARFHQTGFAGGNVTLPFKEQAFALADHVDGVAEAIGAANTVWHDGEKLYATNTDAYGFLANLDQQAPDWDCTDNKSCGAMVLGAGGASRAIIYGLLDRGFKKVIIANRTLSKAQNLVDRFGHACTAEAPSDLSEQATNVSIVVNTTSLGMGDNQLPIDPKRFNKDTLINDIVYAPLMTPLLTAAKSAGQPIVDGLGMLLHQAVPGFERWFGIRPEVTDELRKLLLADLGENT